MEEEGGLHPLLCSFSLSGHHQVGGDHLHLKVYLTWEVFGWPCQCPLATQACHILMHVGLFFFCMVTVASA